MAIAEVSPDLDESKWPVVVVTMSRQAMNDVEWGKYLDQLTQYFARGVPFVLIVDVRAAPPLPPDQRRMVAERLDLHTEEYPNVLRGVAIVLSNAVQRGIVNVMSWLTKRPFQIESFSSIETAMSWAWRLLREPATKSQRPSAQTRTPK